MHLPQIDAGPLTDAREVPALADHNEAVDPTQTTPGHPCQNIAFRAMIQQLGTQCSEQAPAPGHDQVKRTLFIV